MLGKKLINSGPTSSGANTFASENFNTVLYTGNGGTQRIGGYINRGAVFNGSTSYIIVDPSPVAQPDSDADFSLSMFFSTEQVPTSGFRALISDHNPNSGSQTATLALIIYGNSGGQHFSLQRGFNGTGYYYATTTDVHTTLSTNTWYHLVATYQSSNRQTKIYLNGSLLATYILSTTWSAVNLANGFSLGTYYNNSSYYANNWDGKIDQFRIFNKALSTSEVTTLYGETFASTTISTTDIFDDNSGQALYQLDGNANDTGGVTGKFGSAAIFNGSNSKINLGTSSTWANNQLSFAFWYKPTAAPSGANYEVLFSNYTTSFANGFFNVSRNTDYSLEIGLYAGSGWFYRKTSANAVVLNEWRHVVITLDNTQSALADKVKFYINGSSFTHNDNTNSGTPSGNFLNNSNSFYIGHWEHATGYNDAAYYDDLRIYSDVLTATEVGYIYNNTTSSIPTDNLEAYYKFDGNARDEQQLHNGTASNVTYAYDGTASNITYQEATKFSPDLVWIKQRTATANHILFDSVRGAFKQISTSATYGEVDRTSADKGVISFNNNGFTLKDASGGDYEVNGPSGGTYSGNGTYVAWCFNAGSGSSANNTDGTITSTVKANQEAGFSIVKWSSTSSSSDTIGHGLNSKPEVVLYKKTSSTGSWFWYTDVIDGSWDELVLNSTAAKTDFAGTYATSNTFKSVTSSSGADWISYCFHSVDGYQKIGKYTGTGASGNIVETGFEPAWIMIKNTSDTGDWAIFDNKRSPLNPVNDRLMANLSSAESTNSTTRVINFASNGFTVESTHQDINSNNDTYIYLAIAADPDQTDPTVGNSFSPILWSGTGSARSVTGLGFKPDLVWWKSRTNHYNWKAVDSINGPTKNLYNNLTNSLASDVATTSFDDDGFTFGSGGNGNASGLNYVGYAWKAGDHDENLPQINTEGTIDSTVSVNDAAGFSIVKYTGTGSDATIGHGLSSAPQIIIVKKLNTSAEWVVGETVANDFTKVLHLNTSAAASSATYFNNTDPTSTVFSVRGASGATGGAGNFIAYCWYSVTGHSKIGTYTGTGATGNTQALGFKPRFIMIKSSSNAEPWFILDSKRNPTNPVNNRLMADSSSQEDGGGVHTVDFTNTGFTANGTVGNGTNGNGVSYIYMAFK